MGRGKRSAPGRHPSSATILPLTTESISGKLAPRFAELATLSDWQPLQAGIIRLQEHGTVEIAKEIVRERIPLELRLEPASEDTHEHPVGAYASAFDGTSQRIGYVNFGVCEQVFDEIAGGTKLLALPTGIVSEGTLPWFRVEVVIAS